MDELGQVLQNLMKNLPDASSDPPPQDPPQEESVPTFSESGDGEAGHSADGLQEVLGSLLPSGGDLSGLMGAFSGGMPENSRLQLLLALKPHLRQGRCDRIDRLCRMLQTAYGIRGALSMLQHIT